MSLWQLRLRLTQGRLSLDVQLQGGATPLAIVGPNGAGKTTLLRAIAGLCPARGELEVSGHMLQDERGSLPAHRRRIGYVPQGCALFSHLSALDNVAYGLRFVQGRRSRSQARNQAMQMLDELGAKELAHYRVQQLSGGQRQRVALARALVLEPSLLLLDEPMAALDVQIRHEVRGFLAEHLGKRAIPAIVVSHAVSDVAALGACVAVLEEGRIVQEGPLKALVDAPASRFVSAFVAEYHAGSVSQDPSR